MTLLVLIGNFKVLTISYNITKRLVWSVVLSIIIYYVGWYIVNITPFLALDQLDTLTMSLQCPYYYITLIVGVALTTILDWAIEKYMDLQNNERFTTKLKEVSDSGESFIKANVSPRNTFHKWGASVNLKNSSFYNVEVNPMTLSKLSTKYRKLSREDEEEKFNI